MNSKSGLFLNKVSGELVEGSDSIDSEKVFKELKAIDFNTLDNTKIDSIGERVSLAMLDKINSAAKRIDIAKKEADEAGDMKSGWFGKTSKKADSTAAALVATNEAINEMNDMMRALIQYTQLNSKLSKAMHAAMAKMMAEGFKEHSGSIGELSEGSEEFVDIIMSEAEDFANRQAQIEQLQAQHANEIISVKKGNKLRAAELENQIKSLQKKSKEHVNKVYDEMDQKVEETLNRSDENDERHDKLISELEVKTSEINSKSESQDIIHSEQIAKLNKELIRQESIISFIKDSVDSGGNKSKLLIFSFLMSLASMGLSVGLLVKFLILV